MKQATISRLTDTGYQEVGRIAAIDGHLHYQPESTLLQSICREPLQDDAGNEIEDAEQFVEQLHREYCGSYLRASKATEGDDAQG